MGLINAAREKVLAANQETAKEWIYRYVAGQEFAMQVRAIADAFVRMKADLDSEKRAMEKIWKRWLSHSSVVSKASRFVKVDSHAIWLSIIRNS
jgi:hypothetical protein